MKSNNWVTVNIYKYFKSGIAETGEIVNLIGNFKNLKIFTIISTINYTSNMLSIEQIKNKTTNNSFYVDFKSIQGKYTEYKHPNIYDSARNSYRTNTYSYYGYGITVNARCGKGGSDSGSSHLTYRYKQKNGNFTNWITILYSNGGTKETVFTKLFDEFIITEKTEIQIRYVLDTRRYSTAFIDCNIKTISYIPMESNIKGTYHWFAFAE